MGALMEGVVGKGAEVTTEETTQVAIEGSGERWIHGQCLPKTFEVSFAVFYNHTRGVNCTCRLLPWALAGIGWWNLH